jgi:hypothetical protein
VLVALALAVVVLGTVGWVVTRPAAAPPAEVAAGCRVDDAVRVTVAPVLGEVVRAALAGPLAVGEGRCAVAEVRTEPPLQTLGVLAGGDPSGQPQVWVPDDVSWSARAGAAVDAPVAELAATPVVLATSRAVADALGWTSSAPTWAQALLSVGVVLPDPGTEAAGLLALAALQSGAGPGEQGDAAVVRAVLDAGRAGSTPAQALAAAVAGDPGAPVVVTTGQQVATTAAGGELAVVVPAEGSPALVAPVVRTAAGQGSPAVDAVLDRLAAAAPDGGAVRADGWRDAAGRVEGGADQPPVLVPADDVVGALPARLAELAVPSRLLTVVDTSASMDARVGDGAGDGTRATLARDALSRALAVLPDRTVGALWVFARRLDGDQDWRELVPARPFGEQVDGRSQREVLDEQFAALPDLLTPGGTGLHDTVLAAVRAAREGFDPGAVNTVVLLTDGTDEDPGGLGEQQLLDTLAAEADPARPVQVVAIGVGPDADQDALGRIAAATGGTAYPAIDPDDLQTVLFEALRNR